MTRRLVLAMGALAALVAVALAIPMATVVATDQRTAFVAGLQVDTLSGALALSAEPRSQWHATVDEIAQRTGARVVVVDPALTLVADSDHSSLDRSFDRPEVQSALAGSLTSDVRPSATLGQDLRYVAAPIVQDGKVVSAIRLSLPEADVTDRVGRTQRWLVVFVAMVVVAAGLVAWLVARSIAAPLRRVARTAADLPDDLDLRVDEADGPGEVRAVARALNRTAERLAGLLRRTQRVAADASHHLRTPLTGVRLRLEAIEDLSDQADVRSEAQAGIREVDRLSRRIEQVMSLARTDVGDAVSVPQRISDIVADRVDSVAGMFEDQAVSLASEVEPALIVSGPPGLVERVVDEILGNALQYATAEVRVGLVRTGDDAVVTVDDDGPGLPPAERERVFDRFGRGTTAVPGGSGLGLALVRESVTSLGGSVTAGPSPLGGLQVTVVLPLTLSLSLPLPLSSR